MKVLYVSQYFYPETFRGNDIVFDLVKKGHEVVVLTGKPNYPYGIFYKGYKFWGIQNEVINGAKIIRFPTIPRGSGGPIKLTLNYLSFIFFSYPYSRLKIDMDFDVIFVQQLSPVTMALPAIWALKRNKRAKLYLWVLDLWPESITAVTGINNRFIIRQLERLVKYIYTKASYILISSNYFYESINKKVPNKKIIYFPNWAESAFEFNNNLDFDLPKLPTGFNIMFAGNIGEAQDFDTILQASKLTINENINWIIIGDGRKFEWVKNQVLLNNLTNVFILGRYSIEKMPTFFQYADVMLLTLKDSPVFDLTVPAKLQAYLSRGKIILAAINGEAQTIINDNKVGIACSSGDYLSLSECARKIKNMNNKEKNILQKNSLDLYRKSFTKSKLLNNLELIFLKNLIK